MNEPQINLQSAVLSDGLGLIAAAGYINNEGGQAVADAASALVGGGCSSLVIDLDGTRIINSIGVSILLEIMEKIMESELDDPANYTNRSPYPTIQVLREDSIDEILESYPDIDQIPNRNIEYSRNKGLAYMQALLASCFGQS